MPKPLHFIGIAGSGMAPLAAYAKTKGLQVSGSDNSHSLSLQKLRNLGIPISENQSSKSLSNFCGQCVYSSAIPKQNPEYAFAEQNKDIELIHRSTLLANICNTSRKSIAIAGTHGKTTTSFLCHHLIKQITAKPCGFISGANFSNGDLGYEYDRNQKQFVFEADESDGSFLKFIPTIGIINNIDEDHLDFYGTYGNILKHFHQFSTQVLENDGYIILYEKYAKSLKISKQYHSRIMLFGESKNCHYRIKSCYPNESSTQVAITKPDGTNHSYDIPLLGRHNGLNFVAALAAAEFACNTALEAFDSTNWVGINRRLNIKEIKPNVLWIDDYAHNTEKIHACLHSIRGHFPNHNIKILFQPHRYTRLRDSWQNLIAMFKTSQIDSLHLLPVYAAGEQPIANRDSRSLCKYLKRECEFKVTFDFTRKNLQESLNTATTNAKMVIVTVGAGDIKNRFTDLFVKEE